MFHVTERLLLRPAWPEDAAAVAVEIAEEAIVRNLVRAPWPYGLVDAEAFVRRPQDPRKPHFLIDLRGHGVIGSAGFAASDREIEIGYWLGRRWWGRGFATEAANGLIEIARLLGHGRLVAGHFADNPASGRALRKIGFALTGTVRPRFSLARQAHADCVEFALDRDEADCPADWRRAA